MSILLQSPWTNRPPLGTPIDWGHPLAQGLVAWIDADGDRVTGESLSVMGAAERRADGTLYLPGGASDCGYLPAQQHWKRITTDLTAVTFAAVTYLSDAWASLFYIPYRNTASWSAPYAALSFARSGTAGLDAAVGYNSSAWTSFPCADTLLQADGVRSCRAFSKSSSAAFYFKDGILHAPTTMGDLTQVPDFSGGAPLVIGRKSNLVGGSNTGGVFGPYLLYARALSFEELALVSADPWAMFARRRTFFVPHTIATASAASFNVSMLGATPLAAASGTSAPGSIITTLPPASTYWCAEVGAWADFPSEWADEETAWQPVSTDALAGAVSVTVGAQDVVALPVSAGTPTAAGMAVNAVQAQVAAASVAAVSAAVTAALAAIETTAVSLAYAQAAAALLESAAQAAEGLAATIADPGAATLTATAYTPTVSTTAEVVAQVAAAMLALEALTPTTSSAATATPGVASLTVAAREAAGTALARIEVAVATLSMAAGDATTQSACTAEASAATLAAILGNHVGLPLAIVTPDAVSASLLSQAVEALAKTTAPATAAVLAFVARSITAGTGVKEVARLISPITTTARRKSYIMTSYRTDSEVATRARLRSYIETEQT